MMLASKLRPAKRPTIRSAALFTDRCNLRSSLHSYYQAYRDQAQRQNSWFGRGRPSDGIALAKFDALGLQRLLADLHRAARRFLSRNGDIKSPVHMIIHDAITNAAGSTIEDHVCSNQDAENRYSMGTNLQIRSFLTKTPFARCLHDR